MVLRWVTISGYTVLMCNATWANSASYPLQDGSEFWPRGIALAAEFMYLKLADGASGYIGAAPYFRVGALTTDSTSVYFARLMNELFRTSFKFLFRHSRSFSCEQHAVDGICFLLLRLRRTSASCGCCHRLFVLIVATIVLMIAAKLNVRQVFDC